MTMPQNLILITGPARSGKSEWAEQLVHRLAMESGKTIVYIATSQVDPTDSDWQQRIAQHQARRPETWVLQEVPTELAIAINEATPNQCLLIDSLGTWVANLIEQDNSHWQQQVDQLLGALTTQACDIVLVGEETGWGVIPAYPVGRTFRDRLGNLVRQIGAISTDVYLATGGYALNLKSLGTPIPQAPNNLSP